MDRNTGGKAIHNARYIASGLVPANNDPDTFSSEAWESLSESVREEYRQTFEAVRDKIMDEWDGKVIRIQSLETASGTPYRKTGPIMTIEELGKIYEIAGKYSKYCHPELEPFHKVFVEVVNNLIEKEKAQILKFKAFQDDILTYLRAIALVADTVGNAGTHAEKNARMRGLIAQIESAIQIVRDGQEYTLTNHYFGMPDLFRSNYPIQQYIEKCRALEAENKLLKERSTTPDDLPL